MNSQEPLSPTVVLVHGYMDDAAAWSAVRARLGERSIPTTAVSLAGMGESAGEPGPYTLTRWADDLAATVAGIDGPVVLVGHSMGGQLAELAAVREADRVRALILVNPIPLAGTGLPDDQIAAFRSPDLSLDGQRAFRGSLSTAFPVDEIDRLAEVAVGVAPQTIAATADAWNDGHPDGREPSRFRGPVAILRGEDDPFVTEDIITAYVAPRFGGAADERRIPGAGHWPHVENPAAVAEAITGVVEAVRQGTADDLPAQAWTNAFKERTPQSFADGLAADVLMEASALAKPIIGKDRVKVVMATVSEAYESLEFLRKTQDGPRTYLEWEATAFGGFAMRGITILTRDDDGLIEQIAIHHRPLGAVMQIASNMGAALVSTGDFTPDYFNYTEGE